MILVKKIYRFIGNTIKSAESIRNDEATINNNTIEIKRL